MKRTTNLPLCGFQGTTRIRTLETGYCDGTSS